MGKLMILLYFILSVFPADATENRRHIHVVRRGSKKTFSPPSTSLVPEEPRSRWWTISVKCNSSRPTSMLIDDAKGSLAALRAAIKDEQQVKTRSDVNVGDSRKTAVLTVLTSLR